MEEVNKAPHKPKSDIVTKFKVVRYGERYLSEDLAEQKLYCFRHQNAELKVTEGFIPIHFLSMLWLDEGQPLFLQTRCGGFDEFGYPVGPEYSISWKAEREPVPPVGIGEDVSWLSNLDDLWIAALNYFERKNSLSEETLDYLDADPFVLFGLDDYVTQQALRKLEKVPALMCEGTASTLEEWGYYLRIPPEETAALWIVEAFAESELPKPWTCYKGAGSIVCFFRSDTGMVTWKHPFYDYFRQMRDFCRQAIPEQVIQVRITRLLWEYESSRIETEHYQEPLVSPEYVEKLAKIFGYDLKREGCIVRNLRALLKVFARTYRATQDVDMNDVLVGAETLERDTAKYVEMKEEWGDASKLEAEFLLKDLTNGKITCVNCETTALCYCLECKDYLCLECYDALHQKGGRLYHAPFKLVICALCLDQPAKLHCNFTDKHLCKRCYAFEHIKGMPPDGKENPPRIIEYDKQYMRYATFAKERSELRASMAPLDQDEEVDDYASVLSTDWHPFYDSRGVKYYHNFLTGERMRQSPRRVPTTTDPGAPPDVKDKSDRNTEMDPALQPLHLNGFNSLDTGLRACKEAAADPNKRGRMRYGHYRINMPNEVPEQ